MIQVLPGDHHLIQVLPGDPTWSRYYLVIPTWSKYYLVIPTWSRYYLVISIVTKYLYFLLRLNSKHSPQVISVSGQRRRWSDTEITLGDGVVVQGLRIEIPGDFTCYQGMAGASLSGITEIKGKPSLHLSFCVFAGMSSSGHFLLRFCGHFLWRAFCLRTYFVTDISYCVFFAGISSSGHFLLRFLQTYLVADISYCVFSDISCGGHFFFRFFADILWRSFFWRFLQTYLVCGHLFFVFLRA